MACGCQDRGAALRRALAKVSAGKPTAAARELGFVARSLAQDARSGELRKAAAQRVAQMRAGARR